MIRYARYISENSVAFPSRSEFAGVVGWEKNDSEMRSHGYMPLEGVPQEVDGKTLALTGFELVQQSESRTVTRYREVTDYDEEGAEIGRHIEPYEVTIEQDTSYIRVTSYEYQDIPEPEPPQPSEEVVQATAAIINRIAELVVSYDAIDDVKALENVNIESLLALAAQKSVTPEDMARLKEDIVLLKTDLEGKMDANWYRIWNGWLKGAIAEALRNMAQKRKAAGAAGK